jgi:hypothetical protein
MLIFGTNVTIVKETKSFISSHFDLKDLGDSNVILELKWEKNDNGFSFCQSYYIEKILKKFNYYDELPAKTPYDRSIHLKKNNGSSVSQVEYAKIIGSVMFLMNCTRPDLAYDVSTLSWCTHNPGNEHQTAIHLLLRYVKGVMDWCLHFCKFLALLKGFCDETWVTDNDETISSSGYIFTLGGGSISRKSPKQTCIEHYVMESKFIALDLYDQETKWLRNLMGDVPLWGKRSIPASLHCDS